MIFTLAFLSFVAVIGIAFLRTRRRNSDLAQLDWNALLDKLAPVPVNVISQIAIGFLEPSADQGGLDRSNLWELIGGDEGLHKLYSNSHVLLALAHRAEQWDPEESSVIIGQMRQDAAILRRCVVRLSMGLSLGIDRSDGPFSIQQAASAYYLMRRRVLVLYANHHGPRMTQLASIL